MHRYVVDFGCAECGLSRFLKDIESLEKISFIDIDKVLLDLNKFRIKPLTYDYLHNRKNPLTIRIYEGNVTEIDPCIMGFEAVTMIEFIEHLVSEDLEKVISAVFGCLNPRLVVMTTPNYEFNQLFPSYPSFRHYDHKFEWTRKQFQEWCSDICRHNNYSVQFEGIGNGPDGSENLGTCSQAAIFVNGKTSPKPTYNDIKPTLYNLVAESIYPHEEENDLSLRARLNLEINYYTREHLKLEKYELTPDENYVMIAREIGEDWREKYYSDFHQDEVYIHHDVADVHHDVMDFHQKKMSDDIPEQFFETKENLYPVEEELWD
ncbi:hypothetical protein KUTeg_021513 [Tegillarca granosa]|uniref:Small RNA 2'-O-methyltransferase n=1 Tax=Tegillarca granosa TaxID=220873 RepID=A0ABQ9E3T7_TEGGR|nr:hypothetical protein KUTeg_021513 [Tegillarca granosa]